MSLTEVRAHKIADRTTMTSYFVGAATLEDPGCQVCTAAQFSEPHFQRLTDLYHQTPRLHRKQWEYAYILRFLEKNDLLRAGRSGIGFGVGDEPILAVMAAAGMDLTATEQPHFKNASQREAPLSPMDVFYGGICEEDEFHNRVRVRSVDMNQMPADLGKFDLVWASSVIEELGSIKASLDAVVASTKLLRKGGFGVFTTQMNLNDDCDFPQYGPISVWDRVTLLDLQARLIEAGCEMAPINLSMSRLPEDEIVDRFPFDNPVHLKIQIESRVVTSVGFAFRKD